MCFRQLKIWGNNFPNYQHKSCPNFVWESVWEEFSSLGNNVNNNNIEVEAKETKFESSFEQILLLFFPIGHVYLLLLPSGTCFTSYICLSTSCLSHLCNYDIDLFLKTMSCSSWAKPPSPSFNNVKYSVYHSFLESILRFQSKNLFLMFKIIWWRSSLFLSCDISSMLLDP